MVSSVALTPFYWIVAALMLVGSTVYADDAPDNLAAQLAATNELRAEIVQRVYANGLLLEESTGHFALARPNFRWQVETPFPQIILLTDQQLQIYDADLRQLTIRDLDIRNDALPARFLMQPKRLLDGNHTVTQLVSPEGAKSVTYRLSPNDSASLFQRLEFTFTAKKLASLVIVDWQNQQTQITFNNLQSNFALPPDLFRLTIPEGTDIIRG